ncbi:MAG: AAA family ATPase, partial [Rhodospirillales bacterium]|nr:AAA family ATPase [Rhodospirillales bacterium]
MARTQVHFVCRQCGESTPRWQGKCPGCGQWNTLEEFREAKLSVRESQAAALAGDAAMTPAKAVRMHEIDAAASPNERWATRIAEFDRVLGGTVEEGDNGEAASAGCGLVPGSAVLIGGDPGIGKSTLILQAAAALAQHGKRVLYVSSEESLQQVRLRARRLTQSVENDELYVLAETNLARILEQVRQTQPDVLMIASIQMIYKSDLTSSSGTVTQLRGCAFELVQMAKVTGAALLLIGHVT